MKRLMAALAVLGAAPSVAAQPPGVAPDGEPAFFFHEPAGAVWLGALAASGLREFEAIAYDKDGMPCSAEGRIAGRVAALRMLNANDALCRAAINHLLIKQAKVADSVRPPVQSRLTAPGAGVR